MTLFIDIPSLRSPHLTLKGKGVKEGGWEGVHKQMNLCIFKRLQLPRLQITLVPNNKEDAYAISSSGVNKNMFFCI